MKELLCVAISAYLCHCIVYAHIENYGLIHPTKYMQSTAGSGAQFVQQDELSTWHPRPFRYNRTGSMQ